jgi:metal transporter CNNM
MDSLFTWLGIVFCLTQSAMFSGLNLGFFSIGRLRLEAEAEHGNAAAQKVLALRKDANFLLCTLLWGNVGVNVLLALLSESVLSGIGGFAFSTIGITIFGEIVPQAYFSRHAIRVAALLSPIVHFYQLILFPVAKPIALILDGWIGPEGISFMRERDIEAILRKHIYETDSEISATEGRGALNFLDLDDRSVCEEGREIDPSTIFAFPAQLDLPKLPRPDSEEGRAFLEALKGLHGKWAVITDAEGVPEIVLETESFLYAALTQENPNPYAFCHRPIVVFDPDTTLDSILSEFVVEAENTEDQVIDRDVALFWSDDNKRIITGADILGRLLHGIVRRVGDYSAADEKRPRDR